MTLYSQGGIEDSLAPTVKRPRGYNTPQFLSNLFGILRKPGEESYPKQIISEQLHITMKPSQIQALFSAIMLFSLPALAAKKNCGGCPICQGDVCHYTDPNGQPACKQLSTTPFRVKVTPGDRCYDRGHSIGILRTGMAMGRHCDRVFTKFVWGVDGLALATLVRCWVW
ncbi:unnamed protein product [Zymoseptoria tritici ST99CH_3D7]|uniref:Uncharacterized protein n=1 Tax=Zymoseptoria tritici (strain ST99CH_3D7) TaxID=1276538 RepID=A0A1X7SA27_ZYMT9|nr:unnamed protein product [Zymoseptoria tritici ST99CH_3D7]